MCNLAIILLLFYVFHVYILLTMYLLVNVGGPETSHSAFMGVGRKKGGANASKHLVNILDDDHGLA